MTDTKFDDLPWLDETPPESAEAPLSEEAKRSLETERLEHERHAVMEEGRDEAFSEIMRRVGPSPLSPAMVIRMPARRGRQKAPWHGLPEEGQVTTLGSW